MARVKTFLIYLILIVIFFIFSNVMIYVAINTTYKYKSVEINTAIPTKVEVQATSINGFAKAKINNNTENSIENKYLKVQCYSQHDILMGTKYIKIDKIEAKEEKEFEVHFNYNKVEKAVISITDEEQVEADKVPEADRVSDSQRGIATIISALILLYFI
ncbi:MAG: hypothetical protein GX682_04980 [Clostridiaceae bacterium]|nr:hypothetical protein [Clostridiaceae bacterium]